MKKTTELPTILLLLMLPFAGICMPPALGHCGDAGDLTKECPSHGNAASDGDAASQNTGDAESDGTEARQAGGCSSVREVSLSSFDGEDSCEDCSVSSRTSEVTMTPRIIRLGPASPELEVAEAHGLLLLHNRDGASRYVTYLAGQEVVVKTVAAEFQDMKALGKEFAALTIQKIEELESRYSVSISRNGIGLYAGKLSAGGEKPLEVRQPLYSEVLALEYALERSLPASNRKTQLQILFTTDLLYPDRLAQWELSSNGKPTIIVGANRGESLDYVLMHELAHHAQYKMGYQPLAARDWRVGRDLGWLVFHNRLTGESGWAITSSDGCIFKYNSTQGKWVRCNKEGQCLNAEGKRVKRSAEAQLLSSSSMLLAAKIRPCTGYMTNPMEVQAEALAMYRMSSGHRARLLRRSPELYRLVQEFDQKHINHDFGDGLIRAANGCVVTRTGEIAAEVRHSPI